MKLALIPAGVFMMGSPDQDKEAESDERPWHRVRINRPFYLGVCEVTQGQYRALTGKNPSELTGSDNLPVDSVSWYDAIAFCNALSVREGLKPCYLSNGGAPAADGDGYRLPTEAEWEYACRAGTTTRFSFGDDGARLGGFGWHKSNSADKTHPVGEKKANPVGLHDMYGNVLEWCWDLFNVKSYAHSLGANPLVPPQDDLKVARGGSFGCDSRSSRSADRWCFTPGTRRTGVGFRAALVVSEAGPGHRPNPGAVVNSSARPIDQEKQARPELASGEETNQAPDEAPGTIAKKSTEPGVPRKTIAKSRETPKRITNVFGMKLVLIPAGEFLMGSPDSNKEAQNDEKPQHRVRITQPFYMGATEVTQGQYRAIAGQIPSAFTGSDDLPVDSISWDDAIAFCNTLSVRVGLKQYYAHGGAPSTDEGGYRLPTEAEWQYACRAGSTTRFGFGDDAANLGEFAWYKDNSGGRTQPVGQKRPNAWGLYDMHGNLWEWCTDWYDAKYYGQSPDTDPPGPSKADARVILGAGWSSGSESFRVADRGWFAPGRGKSNHGFRVVRVPSER